MASSSQIWVETDFFQIEPGEEDETNPGRFGRTFAHWLAEQFKLYGEPVQAVLAEDWGWCVMLSRKPFPLWVGCSNRDGSLNEWGAFVTAEPGILQRLRGPAEIQAAIHQRYRLLQEIVRSAPRAERVWEE